MFKAKTEKIRKLSEYFPNRIDELEKMFSGVTNIYIDLANVKPWCNALGWKIDLKRLKQFLNSFDNIRNIKIYFGTLQGNRKSEDEIKYIKNCGYNLKTKPVKIMKHSIDATSISMSSVDLLKDFVRKCLLKKWSLETVEYLNDRFKGMNQLGEYYIEDRKCNFDVEIGRDMLLDFSENNTDTFVLWSGDSDFADPIRQLLDDGKRVILFATVRKVSRELNELRSKGLLIFEIEKIRNFICWKKEIERDVWFSIKSKEDPDFGTPKH